MPSDASAATITRKTPTGRRSPTSRRASANDNNARQVMTYAPHQQRVVDEKTELDERRAKLGDFIAVNPIFQGLPEAEQERLKHQRKIMSEYSDVLGQRIDAFAA